ncbi:MAG: hypothetical protein HY308_15165 [Gammaproteobacteria bacterium]|nr:hypothetical protein [Gammaproteobacteria bacterium]
MKRLTAHYRLTGRFNLRLTLFAVLSFVATPLAAALATNDIAGQLRVTSTTIGAVEAVAAIIEPTPPTMPATISLTMQRVSL